ncbi:MAG: UvrD-helicase domain-containing protein [bacterium]
MAKSSSNLSYYLYGLSKYLENLPITDGRSASFLQDLGRGYYREALAASDCYTRQSFEKQSLKLKGFVRQGREVFEQEGRFYEALLMQYGGYLPRLQASLLAAGGPPLIFLDVETNWYGEIRELAFLHTQVPGIYFYACSPQGLRQHSGSNDCLKDYLKGCLKDYLKDRLKDRSKDRPQDCRKDVPSALAQGLEALKTGMLANPYWVGHQIREHDLGILKNHGLDIPDDQVIDTLELSAIAYPLWPDLRLRCPHRALEDVYQTVRLFISLVIQLRAKPEIVRNRIQRELPIFQTLWDILSSSGQLGPPGLAGHPGQASPDVPAGQPAQPSGPERLPGTGKDLAPLYELQPQELLRPGYEAAAITLMPGNNVIIKDRLPYCFTQHEGTASAGTEGTGGEDAEPGSAEAGSAGEDEGAGAEGEGTQDVVLVGSAEHILDEEKTLARVTSGLAGAFLFSFFAECRSRKVPCSGYLLHPIPHRKWCQGKLQFIRPERYPPGFCLHEYEHYPVCPECPPEGSQDAGQKPGQKQKNRLEPGHEPGKSPGQGQGSGQEPGKGTRRVYFLEELPLLNLTEQEFKTLHWPDRASYYLSRLEWSFDSAGWPARLREFWPAEADEARRQQKKRINFLLHRASRNWLRLPKAETGTSNQAGQAAQAGQGREPGRNYLWESGFLLLNVLTGEIRLYPQLESLPWLVAIDQAASSPAAAGKQSPQRAVTTTRFIRVIPDERQFLISPDSPYHHTFYSTLLLCILQQVRKGNRVVFLYDPEKCSSRNPWPEIIRSLKAGKIRVNMARSSEQTISADGAHSSAQAGPSGIGGISEGWHKPKVSRSGIFRNLELLFQGRQEACFFPVTALAEVVEAFSFHQRAFPDGKQICRQRPILLLESLPFRIPLGYSLFASGGSEGITLSCLPSVPLKSDDSNFKLLTKKAPHPSPLPKGAGENRWPQRAEDEDFHPTGETYPAGETCSAGDIHPAEDTPIGDIHSLELIFRKFRPFYQKLFDGLDAVHFFDYRIPDIETSRWPMPPAQKDDGDVREKVNQLFNPRGWEEQQEADRERDIDLLLRHVFFREGEFSQEQYEKTQKKNVDEFFDSKDSRHRLITLPTGGGKSLIFQLPAIIRTACSGRLVVIISPLKALIQEQSFKLCSLGMFDFVAGFHQDLDREEVDLLYRQIQDGTLRIVYVTPERFRSPAFRKVLQRRAALDSGLEFVVFDEVHCVADWGYHFRPDYLCCYQDLLLHEIYGRVQGFLFSATITETNLRLLVEKVRPLESEDQGITGNQVIRDVNPENRVPLRPEIEKYIFPVGRALADKGQGREAEGEGSSQNAPESIHSPGLPNGSDIEHPSHLNPSHKLMAVPGLKLMTMPARASEIQAERLSAIRKIIEDNLDSRSFRALIFYQSQTGTEELAEALNEALIKDRQGRLVHFDCFHAGIPVEEREMIYRRFAGGEIQALVATRAFGMGMDIPNISLVIHYQRPQTLEEYLQEIGRAARQRSRFSTPARAYVLLAPDGIEGSGSEGIAQQQDAASVPDLTREAVLNIRSELMEQVFKKGTLREATFSLQFHGLEFRFDERLAGISKFSFAPQKRRKEAIVRSALYWLSQYEAGIFEWGEYRLYGLEVDLIGEPALFPSDKPWQKELHKTARAVFSLQEMIRQYDGDERACYLDILHFQREGAIAISHRSIQPTSFVLPGRSEKGNPCAPDANPAMDCREAPDDRSCFFPLFFPLELSLALFEKIRQKYLGREPLILWPDLVAWIAALIREYRPREKLFFSEDDRKRIWGGTEPSAELEELYRSGFFQKLPDGADSADDNCLYELDLYHLSEDQSTANYPCLEAWMEKHRIKMLHDLVKKSRRIGHLFRFWQKHKIMAYRMENPVKEKNLAFRILEINPKHRLDQDVALAQEIYRYLHRSCQAESRMSHDTMDHAGRSKPEAFGLLGIYERFHRDHSLEEMRRALILLKVMGYIHYFEQEEEIGYRLVRRAFDRWNESALDRIREISQLAKVKEFLTRIFFTALAAGDRELADQLIVDYFTCPHSGSSPGFSARTLALLQKPEYDQVRLRIQGYFAEEKLKGYLEAKDRELDDDQKELVETFSRGESLIVRAGPGAGKTRTLIYAVLDLLIRKGVPPEHILLLSYTRRAVVELHRRIRAYQPQFDLLNDWQKLNIDTFHGFARKILGPEERARIREEIRDRKGRGGESGQTELFHQKCLERAAGLFSARHYHYLLIDEFQDVLAERLEFIKTIIRTSHRENLKVFLVGDPLQDIFHYQCPQEEQSSFDLIETYLAGQSIAHAERELTRNYRSSGSLCRFFDEYVADNYAPLRRIHRPAGIWKNQADGSGESGEFNDLAGGIIRKIALVNAPDAPGRENRTARYYQAMYQQIAEDITRCCTAARTAHTAGDLPVSRNLSIAILGRNNQEVEAAFHHLYRILSPLGRCLPLNENFPLWRRWDVFEAIQHLAGKERQGLRVEADVIQAAFNRFRDLGMVPGYIGSYRNWEPLAIWVYLNGQEKGFAHILIRQEQEEEENGEYRLLFGHSGSGGGYDGWRQAGVQGQVDIRELEDYLIEEAPLRREEIAGGEGGIEVIFSTVHKVKGLEFDAVYLLPFGMPPRKSKEGEEKNIGYVGITRARERVIRYLPIILPVREGNRASQVCKNQGMMPVVLSFPGRELISREFGLRFDAWREGGIRPKVDEPLKISRTGELFLDGHKSSIVIGKINPNCLKGCGSGPWAYRIRELYVRFYSEEDPAYWMGYTEFLKDKVNQGAYFLLPVLERVQE